MGLWGQAAAGEGEGQSLGGIDMGRRGRRRGKTTDSENLPNQKTKMLYHSNQGKCLKKESGQLCQYRGTVSQIVCGYWSNHVRITQGDVKNSDF